MQKKLHKKTKVSLKAQSGRTVFYLHKLMTRSQEQFNFHNHIVFIWLIAVYGPQQTHKNGAPFQKSTPFPKISNTTVTERCSLSAL